jgi:hypothetical protein
MSMSADSIEGAAVAAGQELHAFYMDTCQQMGVKADPNVIKVLQGQRTQEVTCLDFQSNFLGMTGMGVLLQCLTQCPRLEELSFENNYLKPEMVPPLVKAVRRMVSLTSLNLANNNNLGFSAAKLLLQMVKTNKRIVDLDLDGTGIVPATKDLIYKHLAENASSAQYWASLNASGSPTKKSANGAHVPTPPKSQPAASARPQASGSPVETEKTQNTEAEEDDLEPKESKYPGYKDPPDADALQKTVQDNAGTNLGLRESVKGGESRTISLHAQLIERNRNNYTQLVQRHDGVDGQMNNFDEEYTTPGVYHGYTAEQLIKEVNLSLSEADLVQFGEKYGVGTEKVDRLLDIPPMLEEMGRLDTVPGRAEVLEDKIKMCTFLDPHYLSSEMTLQSYRLVHSRLIDPKYVFMNIRDLEDEKADLMEQRENWNHQRDHALATGAIGVGEGYHMMSLDTQEKLFKLMVKRVNILKDMKGQQHLSKEAQVILEKSAVMLEECRNETQATISRVEEDIKKVEAELVVRQKAFDDTKREFEMTQLMTRERIAENVRKQNEIFDGIGIRFQELEKLGEEHQKEVEEYLKERAKFDDAESLLREFEDVLAIHKHNLSCISVVAEKTTSITDDFAKYFASTPGSIQKKAEYCWKETEKMTKDEQIQTLTVFEKYMLDIGELLYKKEKRVTEIERMRRNNTFSVEMCTEVLDPNAAKYEEQGKEMDYQKEQMEDKVQALRERADAACEIFQEIEDALNEMGYKFVHPKILMAEIMVDGTAHIMERKRQIYETEQQYIDADDEDLGQSVSQLEVAKMSQSFRDLPRLSTPNTNSPKKGVSFAKKQGNLVFD